MRLGPRHLLLLVAPVLLPACPSPAYNGPVEVPQLEAAVPVGAYVALGPFLRGPYAPAPASSVTAKCVDASMCEVAVVGSEVRVGGKKAGRAEVVVAYDEADGTPGESHVFVNFADGLTSSLKPGKHEYEPERLQTIDQVWLGGRRANFACSNDAVDGRQRELAAKLDLGSPSRGRGVLHTCLNARALSSSDTYYRFASWGVGFQETSTPDEIVYVCAQTRPQSTDYLSLTMYQLVDGVPVVLERRGEEGDVCGLAPESPKPQATGEIVSIDEWKDGPVGKTVNVRLQAPSGQGCDVLGYELRWPGGSKTLELDAVHVDAGKTDERELRIDLTNGDLVALTTKEASVFPRANCP